AILQPMADSSLPPCSGPSLTNCWPGAILPPWFINAAAASAPPPMCWPCALRALLLQLCLQVAGVSGAVSPLGRWSGADPAASRRQRRRQPAPCPNHTVAPFALGPVQSCVGSLQQGLGTLCALQQSRPDGDGVGDPKAGC